VVNPVRHYKPLRQFCTEFRGNRQPPFIVDAVGELAKEHADTLQKRGGQSEANGGK
jgi:hypothetical protein